MSIETVAGQVAMVGGQPQSRAAGILVDERISPRARGRERGALYIQVQILEQRAGREVMADRLAQTVQEAYSRQRGSVTAGLQRAIHQTNHLLFSENENSLPGDRWTAGITCAVLRDEHLFVAQAGPAALFVAHQGEIIRYPFSSPWLDDPALEETDVVPLGRGPEVDIDLFYSGVTRGDTIVLVDWRTAQRLPADSWPRILSGRPVEAVLSRLLAAAEGHELAALAARVGEQVRVQAARPQPSATPLQRSQPAAERRPKQRPGWPKRWRLGERARAAGLALGALGGALVSFLKGMVPSGGGASEPRRREAATPARPRQTRRDGRAQEHPRSGGSLVRALLIALALVIPLAVAGAVGYTVYERERNQQAELDELWQAAQLRWREANVSSDPTTIRALLNEATGHLERLLEKQPGDPAALNLLRSIETRMDEIGQVRRVHWEGVLRTYPSGAGLSRVVVEGVHLFVMDRKNQLVYHHTLDEFQQALLPESLETLVVRKGDRVGNVLAADMVDMAWMPVGNGRLKAGLLILDSGGNLIEYNPETKELILLRVAATDAWQYPRLIGSHSGRFYVLDSRANQIWRYSPTPDGYSSAPSDWLRTSVDLTGVVDMAVGDSIFLLYVDGRIQKLTNGRPDIFDLSDWDMAPSSATALFTRPPADTQWLYVADPNNSRIVQCSREGLFRQQFLLAESQAQAGQGPLGNVISLFVDEKGFKGPRAYFLSGNQLHVLVMPDLIE
jgi:hypothetical protein